MGTVIFAIVFAVWLMLGVRTFTNLLKIEKNINKKYWTK